MTSEFINKQNKLFARYYWSGVIGWSLAGLTIFVAALRAPGKDSALGPILIWSGIIIIFLTAIYRYFLKNLLQQQFWDECARILHGSEVDVANTFHEALAGPVVKDNAHHLTLRRAVSGTYKNYPAILQDIQVTYQKNTPGRDDATFTLDYII